MPFTEHFRERVLDQVRWGHLSVATLHLYDGDKECSFPGYKPFPLHEWETQNGVLVYIGPKPYFENKSREIPILTFLKRIIGWGVTNVDRVVLKDPSGLVISYGDITGIGDWEGNKGPSHAGDSLSLDGIRIDIFNRKGRGE